MRIKILSVVIGGLALLAATVPAASATPPLQVSIEDVVETSGHGDFVASGPAVDAGVMCKSGTTAVLWFRRTDASPDRAILRIKKVATCDDGSGTINVNMRVFLDLNTGGTTAKWHFHGGTGDYTRLRGTGNLVGIPGESFLDLYSGQVH
ncbi:MAG: hypothetical protein GY720_10570 [bacterium]|nr:hypothetical protein [bacterium]MCP5030649.1 hypothetical protein [Actinomycetes bacterium]